MEIFAIHLSLSFFSPLCVFHEPIGKQNTKIMNTSNTSLSQWTQCRCRKNKVNTIQNEIAAICFLNQWIENVVILESLLYYFTERKHTSLAELGKIWKSMYFNWIVKLDSFILLYKECKNKPAAAIHCFLPWKHLN